METRLERGCSGDRGDDQVSIADGTALCGPRSPMNARGFGEPLRLLVVYGYRDSFATRWHRIALVGARVPSPSRPHAPRSLGPRAHR